MYARTVNFQNKIAFINHLNRNNNGTSHNIFQAETTSQSSTLPAYRRATAGTDER